MSAPASTENAEPLDESGNAADSDFGGEGTSASETSCEDHAAVTAELTVPPHFAPGDEHFTIGATPQCVEGENCKIDYRITDPDACATAARIEVARVAEPGTVLAKFELEADAFADGQHAFEWDGKGTEGDAAGEFVHVVHSPYLVRLTVDAPEPPPPAEAEVAVLLEEILLERGTWTVDGEEPEADSDAWFQWRLSVLGFHAGQIDGDIGKKSKAAIKNFQRAHQGLRRTGRLDDYTKCFLKNEAPGVAGNRRYQFLLNYLGYRCGPIDGIIGRMSRRSLARYRADKGLGNGDALDVGTKQSLDAETLTPLTRREILEKDLDVAEPHLNAFPEVGKEKKIFIDGDSATSPGSLPYNQKFDAETKNLIRPHFPVIAKPIVKRSDGKKVFAPAASGPLRIDFAVDTAAPPANLGIPNATTRTYVQGQLTADGNENVSGHHVHENKGGVRKADDPGVFLSGGSLAPYDVQKDGALHHATCAEEDGPRRGSAGVYFVPSTIGGDRFALVATANTTNFDTPPATAPEAKTGTMVVWRRYRWSKIWLFQYTNRPHMVEGANLGLANWFNPAFVRFETPEANPSPLMVQPRNADNAMIDLPLYTQILRDAGYTTVQLPAAQIQQRFNASILWPLSPAATHTPGANQAYYDAIDGEITAFEERFADTLRELSYLEAPEGLVCLVFDENAPQAGTMGLAALPANMSSWSWSLLASTSVVHLIHDQDTASGTAINGETMAHETGHALWLHHSSTSAGNNPHPDDIGEHNPAEFQTCTMSYVALPQFCGRCVLKLRGCDETTI